MKNFRNKLAQLIPISGGRQNTMEWIRLTSLTGGTQILMQVIGLMSGILVIRLLPTSEYAFYTLANTMLGTMVVLADSGIASGVMAQGGKVWRDREQLGAVLTTGMALRKKFAVGSLILAAPVLMYLLHHHGASLSMSILIMLSLIPAFMSSLSGAIFMIPLKLKQDIRPLQKNLVFESIGRFALIFSLFLLPWTFIAILGSGIPRLFTNLRLRKISSSYADWKQKSDKAIRAKILSVVKRLMPGAVYYCISGQMSVWLISIFGSTASVAQIGALGRIAVALTVISAVFSTLVYPRFARMSEGEQQLLKKFIQIMGALLFACSVATFVVWLFSDEILWVLGEDYARLNTELVISVIGSCIGIMSGGAFVMSNHRSWPIHPGLSIPVSIVAIISGAILMDVSTLQGVLLFNVFVVSVQFFLNSGYFFFSLNRSHRMRKLNPTKHDE